MTRFEVTLKDRTVELIEGADAYTQEGQMTTFFRTREERAAVDAWAVRVASIRTSEILMIRRLESAATASAVAALRSA
ncbi:MAG: hypothetical protein ACKVWR_22555 [Acidimicrobiales bacterium]